MIYVTKEIQDKYEEKKQEAKEKYKHIKKSIEDSLKSPKTNAILHLYDLAGDK